MTREEKDFLLKDLCARLPYHVIVEYRGANVDLTQYARSVKLENCKPYLRPMSSMTQEEIDEYDAELDKDMDIVINGSLDKDRHITSDGKHNFSKNFVTHFGNDWLNAHHFDYRGLIEKGLALEAPKDMYKIE